MSPQDLAAIKAYIDNNINLSKIAASGGSVLLGAATHTGLNLTSFSVRADTVISALTVRNMTTGVTADFLTSMLAGGTGLIQGDFFPVLNGYRIVTMTIASGSVIGYM